MNYLKSRNWKHRLTIDDKKRCAECIFFSNDGLIFVSYDHADSFVEIR